MQQTDYQASHFPFETVKLTQPNTLRHTSNNRMNLYCTADWAALQLLMHDMLFTVQPHQAARIIRVVLI